MAMLQAKIHPYFPYFHVDVAALVFMFQPVVGAAISMPLIFACMHSNSDCDAPSQCAHLIPTGLQMDCNMN